MSATAAAIATEIAVKGFGTLFSELIKKTLFNRVIEDQPGDLPSSRFKDSLSQTFDRCTRMKTLISRDVPVNLLEQYVHVKFTHLSKDQNIEYDDFEVIDQIRERKRVTIQGTAGGGKTVFMRYLWISYFVESRGKIPIFLELRRLNELTVVDLTTFIFRNIITNDEKIGMDIFKKSISEGRFTFVFDGFDELSEERRPSVEKQILELSARYKDNLIVVSGRPDSRFEAWQDFSTFRVKALEKEQVIDLIKKVDFDQVIKHKFIDAINRSLYERHESFLSSPLLATMMLLTFSHYAEIPEKIHVFYDLAFDTLFSKHDALKEAFSRRKYTDLSIDIFKRRFSFFCLLSYIDEKFEFTRDELLRYIRKSAEIDGVEIDAEALTRDLLESVCMMQEDGIGITFTHRSFQEYFTAYCLSRMPASKLTLLLPKISSRASDSVFVMILDMNKDLVEEAYVLPAIRKAKKVFRLLGSQTTAAQFAESFGIKLVLEYEKNFPRTFQVDADDSEANQLRRLSEKMYPQLYDATKSKIKKFRDIDKKAWTLFPLTGRLDSELAARRKGRRKQVREEVIRFVLQGGEKISHPLMKDLDRDTPLLSDEETKLLADWFETTGHAAWMKEKSRSFLRLMDQIPRKSRKRGQTLHEILGI